MVWATLELNRMTNLFSNGKTEILQQFAPSEFEELSRDQKSIPKLAKDARLAARIEEILPTLPTLHAFHLADATSMRFLKPESVHLVVTSPPYWNLKAYKPSDRQLGNLADYRIFLAELGKVWRRCYKALVPGGRLVCVVGDVCLSRRKNNGRHVVVPLHASIQEQCRAIGFDNLSPIIWHKISNAKYEASGNSTFLGKPYEPNAVIKNDIEFILMQRRAGGYRKPTFLERAFSVISDQNHKAWFNQIWTGLTGASTREHPAPFPVELAARLIRMFSFVGDTVLDPFSGSASTAIAAWRTGRNSVNVEVEEAYLDLALQRFDASAAMLSSRHTVETHR